MNNKHCPKIKECPIFQKKVLFSERLGETYRNLFCNVPEYYSSCKRYIVSEKTGLKIPENIMPNSKLSIDEIINRIK